MDITLMGGGGSPGWMTDAGLTVPVQFRILYGQILRICHNNVHIIKILKWPNLARSPAWWPWGPRYFTFYSVSTVLTKD